MGTRGSFLGVKRPGREADYSPPFSAEVKECLELYISSLPQYAFIVWCSVKEKAQGQFYLLLYFMVCTVQVRPDSIMYLVRPSFRWSTKICISIRIIITTLFRNSAVIHYLALWSPVFFVFCNFINETEYNLFLSHIHLTLRIPWDCKLLQDIWVLFPTLIHLCFSNLVSTCCFKSLISIARVSQNVGAQVNAAYSEEFKIIPHIFRVKYFITFMVESLVEIP
jgi:hypothetical protein